MTPRSNVWRLGAVVAISSSAALVAPASPAAAADVATVSCAPAPAGTAAPATALASFTPTTPERLVDTRDGTGGIDDPVGAGCTLRIDTIEAGIDDDAEALALSVTAIAPVTGYLTVYPCAGGLLETSNVNMRAGFPTPNLAVARPDASGRICIFTSVETQLIVDVTGWWTEDGGARYVPVEPERVADTRRSPGNRVPAGGVFVVDLSGEVPEGTAAVVANLTLTGPLERGFATAYPCGTPPPGTSNVNFRAREARASAIIVGVDAEQRLCVTTSVDAHVIVDLAGYYEPTPFGPTLALTPLPGTRLADSRDGTGGWSTPFTPDVPRRLRPVEGRDDARQATAVVLNVIALRAEEPGFVEVYPCDADDPETSAVNYTTVGATSNLVTVELSSSSDLCVNTSTRVDVVVDLFGVVAAPAGAFVGRLTLGGETWPPYTNDGADYAVRCPDQTALELELLPGTTARVNGVPVGSGRIPISGADGTLTSVRLTRDGTTRSHWLRCVPDDLPRVDVTRLAPTTPGWYLTVLARSGAEHPYALILDERGAPVWYQAAPTRYLEFRLRDDGLFSGVSQLGPRYGVDPDAGYELFTLTGQVVDTVVTFDEGGVEHPTDHHDIVELPGRRSAVITYPLLAGQDLTVLGAGYLADDVIADNVIQELDDAGNVLWSWRASDHFSYEEATFPVRFPPVPGWWEGDEVDIWHINSLTPVDDGGGDYIASARHLDAVFRIDRATGGVEWILGGAPATVPNKSGGQRLTILGDPLGGPRRQHDAHLEGDVLTLLDNRTATGEPARAVAYRIDTVAGTATMLWSIETASGASSFGLGSFRVAADGSALVSWGNGPTPLFEEFDASRQLALQFEPEDGGLSYRITKEAPSAFSAAVLRATAGGSID